MRETVGKGRSGVRGSMTLFAALSIMLVASFLFVMLEAARQQQLRRMAQMHTSLVLESVFSNYCEPLWTKYQILALNNGRTEEQEAFAKWEYYAKELSDKNFGRGGFMAGANHLRMSTEHTEFTAYRLLTDEEGKAYIKSIADYMRNTVARQTVETLIAQYQQLSGMDIREEPDDSALVGADDAIAAAKEAEAETTEDTVSPPAEEAAIEVEENPLEIVKSLWNQGTLSLVLKNPKEVSKAKEDLSDAVSGRKRYEGCGMEPLQIDVADEVLFTEYLLKHFACYTEGTAAGELAYELEYLLCGNEKDESNLSGTVHRFDLAIRDHGLICGYIYDLPDQDS